MEPPSLVDSLRDALSCLNVNNYPYVENPPSCKKRASVALILRLRPHFNHPPPKDISIDTSLPPATQLENFFAQSWVQHGSPEAIFIKRAARQGDRWTSHVALPGGKRDPGDVDDRATAIRETSEEIGLDLTTEHVLSIGNLPERVVSTNFGKVPIMVLCPFIFIYITPYVPAVKLQPTEVASTHWVPVRVLLSPATRTYEYVDLSDRFSQRGGPFVKSLTRHFLGKMRFSAIRLIPSESMYCSTIAEFFPLTGPEAKSSIVGKLYKWCLGQHSGSAANTRPLLLWGLTLGILADFLDQLPPHNSVKLWSYPTFTNWDSQLIIHLLTFGLKKRNQAQLEKTNQTAVDSETEAVSPRAGEHAVGVMLEGYYDMLRKGALITFAGRLMGSAALVWYTIRWYRERLLA